MGKGKKLNINYKFTDSALLNNMSFLHYLEVFERLVLSMFEWVNLPKSMNAMWLEKSLYFDGMATFLKDDKFNFINTRCCSSGDINIYGLPTKLNCYSYGYKSVRTLYTGLPSIQSDSMLSYMQKNECILIQNDWNRIPTGGAMELFAMRLANCDRTNDINMNALKTPVIVVCDERQRAMMENLYNQYNGNQPFIFGDKKQLNPDSLLQAIKTDAPILLKDIDEHKKEIWNEALTYLGINNILVDKKERLITDEANSNNELINLNLQSRLAPRQEACRQFNEKYGFTGTDKEIKVRVRSDLHNIIKNLESSVTSIANQNTIDDTKKELKEGAQNG